MTSDVELAQSYVDQYSRLVFQIQSDLRELAIDKPAFDLLIGELLKVHRFAIGAEETWKLAIKVELDDRRAEVARRRSFWRPAR